jgi:hypothetical protein
MKIKIRVSPDSIGQLREDMAHANKRIRENGDETMGPFTLSVLQEITRKAEKKSLEMMRESSAMTDVFTEMSGTPEELEEGGNDGI